MSGGVAVNGGAAGRLQETLPRDLLASLVVFLVALPLCMGIAIASGVPPAKGLITGIVGGLVVGMLAGCPLQVSGPAAGLAVIVFELVRGHGLDALGPVLFLAGLIQLAAGIGRVGAWFRMISPAVVSGMLAGIGVLIILSQSHVLVDAQPKPGGLQNLLALPRSALDAITSPGLDGAKAAGLVGIATIALMWAWDKLRPARLRFVPGALIAVFATTAMALLSGLDLRRVDVPSNLLDAVDLLGASGFAQLAQPSVLLLALTVALIASAETLLSASAVDRMHDGPRTQYNRELGAQGIGNLICGLLGALPMTGVIVRSSANVQAGARTRLSTVLHGAWLLLFIAMLPGILRLTPVAALAGVLVYTGFKLVDARQIRQLSGYGWGSVAIYFATMLTIVASDLLTGVLVGFGASLLRLAWNASRLHTELRQDAGSREAFLSLQGAATFLRVPHLSSVLERVPPGTRLHLDVEQLRHVDHACLDLLQEWARSGEAQGSELVVDWNHLHRRGEGAAEPSGAGVPSTA
jgi:MFS superfamily sulfate permease-like transporter